MQFRPLSTAQFSQLTIALDELAQSQRTARKLLVCSYAAEGRELIRALGKAGRGWIGFEPTDPRKLANELVAHDIVRDGQRIADAFDLNALLDQAIDETIFRNTHGLSSEIRSLADQVGFRKAIRRSIEALRLEGIDSPTLRCADLEDLRKRNFLADVYAAYETKLRTSKLADNAEVYRRAAHGLSRGTITLPKASIILVPGLPMHGLRGRFIEALRTRGATVLNDDACGAEPPRFVLAPGAGQRPIDADRHIEIFAASSPLHEIKEVLRRCIAAGLHWDEVEIIATDPDVYGCALDSLARRLNIPVSYAVGLPASRTRPGRVVSAYLRWIQEDFSDEVMRALLESGDIVPDGDFRHTTGVSLARTLRKLRIGWGRDRYIEHIDAAERKAFTQSKDDDEESEESQRRTDLLEDLTALRSLFVSILGATPSVPDRLARGVARISPAALANGVATMLQFAVTDHDVDRIAKERIIARLERVRATMAREMSFESAIAILRERLDVKVPAIGAAGPAPWSSSPRHLHLTDVAHGGFTGRRATFVVGLDSGRFPRATVRDPLLTDHDRLQVAPALITTAERVAETQFRFHSLFARLRGDVALSYSAYDTVEGRKLGPAAVVLEAYRIKTENPSANYEDLREATKQVATAVARKEAALDVDDVWLSLMSEDGVIHAAQHVVRNAFGGLNRGLLARQQRQSREVNEHHGLVNARDVLDPRINGDVVSPSRLESLGTCGLRYYYRYVLGIRPPDIPEFDPEVWLDPRNRGSLLHEVYEVVLKEARNRSIEPLSSEFESLALDKLKMACFKWRGLVPPPSDTVFDRECAELRADVSAFCSMCRDDGARWVDLELSFGSDEQKQPVLVPLLGGRIKLQGRVDRVDETENGELVVIDYKTGSAAPYRGVSFDGGRRLQHYLYAIAIEQLLGKKVARMEYRFPTARADNTIVPYDIAELNAGREVISALLDNVAAGRFLPTDDRDDCKFCDFRTCCRVATVKNETVSPLAAWARNLAPVPDEYKAVSEIRGRFR